MCQINSDCSRVMFIKHGILSLLSARPSAGTRCESAPGHTLSSFTPPVTLSPRWNACDYCHPRIVRRDPSGSAMHAFHWLSFTHKRDTKRWVSAWLTLASSGTEKTFYKTHSERCVSKHLKNEQVLLNDAMLSFSPIFLEENYFSNEVEEWTEMK